ncbi:MULTISPECIES: hypothetical protein [Pseudomonadaceae]|uniref:Uncharacterized protein n=1 Tax=Ectopseudomonas alcaliphila TaxID=101564 RepID=A0ABU4Q7B1_9GAMM|nr:MULTISPECIES: hypothetical protein [Pseudomonas]MDP9941634.1 hypothetical protein [Pseudomonas sp. 3400]MDR7013853.1 hypothetical protein [Pseudomonas alcaliphila]MDX5995155.1 hypothetical protein [Pseudomonas alcaliphila]
MKLAEQKRQSGKALPRVGKEAAKLIGQIAARRIVGLAMRTSDLA